VIQIKPDMASCGINDSLKVKKRIPKNLIKQQNGNLLMIEAFVNELEVRISSI
jgi:hypothetical protein